MKINKTEKAILIFLMILLGLAFTTTYLSLKKIDESGGFKAVFERLWEGKPKDTFK